LRKEAIHAIIIAQKARIKPRKNMALKGRLEDFDITKLFNLVHLARKTGALTLERDGKKVTLYFKGGKLIYAIKDSEEKGILNLLFRAGKLSREQVREIEARSRLKSDKEKALIAISTGYLSKEDVLECLQRHFLEIVYELFTWQTGAFSFEPDVLPDGDKLTVSIDLANLILEGTRRQKEWEILQEEIPDLDMALKFTENPRTAIRNISLTVDEWRVISYINPQNTIRQIARYNSMSDYQIRKIVYGLLSAGLVELVPPAGAPKAPPPEIPPALQAPPKVSKGLVQRLIDRIKRL